MTTWQPEYPCIAADPAWNETGGGKIKRGADRHYPLIKKREDILRVMVTAPCWRPAKNAHLWLWVTNNFLLDGLWLMDALGFRYVTNRAWAKMVPNCGSWVPQRPGLGQYLRGQHELLLFGVRGTLPARWKDSSTDSTIGGPIYASPFPAAPKAPGTLLLSPRGEHSQKPDQAYIDMMAVSPGPYLEMFARGDKLRMGWDMWGDEFSAGGCGMTPEEKHEADVARLREKRKARPSLKLQEDLRPKCPRCDGTGRMLGADLCCRACDGTGRQHGASCNCYECRMARGGEAL